MRLLKILDRYPKMVNIEGFQLKLNGEIVGQPDLFLLAEQALLTCMVYVDLIPKELKRLSVLVVKINPTCVVIFMHNVLFFTAMWPANAVQHRSRRFCKVRMTISCNSRLVSAHFSCLNLVSFINSFGINPIRANSLFFLA